MVVTNYPNWPRLFKQIGRFLIVVFLLSLVSILIDREQHALRFIQIPEIAVTVLGSALGILLGFRTSSAYGRWWEARTLWGAMVNNSRSLARQAISFSDEGAGLAPFARRLVMKQIGFVHATRCALRRQQPWNEIQPFLDSGVLQELRNHQNVPAALLLQMGRDLSAAVRENAVNDWQMQRIDATLSELSNVLGACERIKNTPLPRQYDYYPELLIKIYCVALPFVIVDTAGIFTPVIELFVAFAFLALNRIGKNLEDPFENEPYDVPMIALSRTIEINLLQAIGETKIPEPEKMVDGVLM
jgi:ion channel-forming bestrophin family protein